jgi:hypothetical protein
MSPILAGLLVFIATFAGAVLGLVLGRVLPSHHLDGDSKDVVRIAMATVATLAALVVGLLIASAKQSFDERATQLKHAAAETLLLDRTLAAYGPEAASARAALRQLVETRLGQIRDGGFTSFSANALDEGPTIGVVQEAVLPLEPRTDNQRWIKTKALDIASDIAQTRWLLVEEAQSSIQGPFLFILMFWLAALFLSFGLFAPRNALVVVVFLISTISVASSIFVILEMDEPFGGLIRLSSQPLAEILDQLGRP